MKKQTSFFDTEVKIVIVVLITVFSTMYFWGNLWEWVRTTIICIGLFLFVCGSLFLNYGKLPEQEIEEVVDTSPIVSYNTPMQQKNPVVFNNNSFEVNHMRKFRVYYQLISGYNRRGATAVVEAASIADARAIANEQYPNVTNVTEYQ